MASLQGLYGWPHYAAYAAAKAGIIGLTRQIAVDYADDNVRSNAISPGGIATQLVRNSRRLEPAFTDAPHGMTAPSADAPQPADDRPRLRQAGLPQDVAFAALFLASDESAYISGQNLVVDGITSSLG